MNKHAIMIALLRDVLSKGMGVPMIANDDVLRLARSQPKSRADPHMSLDQMCQALRQSRPK